MALASVEQLAGMFDADLWRAPAAGRDERFDAERFATWLEVMLEAGEEQAAARLVELPEDLVTLAFHRQVLVIDLDAMALEMSEGGRQDAEDVEKALESSLGEELEQYRVIARRHDGWDALLAVLLRLDRDHHDYLARLLERLAHASARDIDDAGGLVTALTSEEMLESDGAADREDRRAAEGYVAPSSARAFLALALKTPVEELVAARGRDPVTQAYFRELRAPSAAPAASASASSLAAILAEAGVEPDPTPAAADRLLGAGSPLRRALVELAASRPTTHAQRLAELAYLANVVLSGLGTPRLADAIDRAISVCERGLAHLGGDPVEVVATTTADKLFRIGWRLEASG